MYTADYKKLPNFSKLFLDYISANEEDYLKFAPQLKAEKADHLVMTWQYLTELKTFRVEGYLKKYSSRHRLGCLPSAKKTP